mgnify:CR=1 FL=1
MLTPDYLEACTADIIALYQQLEDDIIEDISRRITRIGMSDSSTWQYKTLHELGSVHHDVIMRISEITHKSEQEIEKLFYDAGIKSTDYDNAVFRKAGMKPLPLMQSPAMLQILKAGISKTNASISNLTGTTATTTQTTFYNAMNRAYTQVSSGAFSYTEAIKRAVKDVSDRGVTVIRYDKNGRVHNDRVDVASRRAVLTGVSQTAGQIQWQNCDEMVCDLVEVTAHYGARPSHSEWQGQVFSRSGTHPKYPDLISNTGYGSGDGLKGWNCRHDFFAFIEGVSTRTYSKKQLNEIENATVTYNGEEIPMYKATQKQRAYERDIRKDKRELVALNGAMKEATGNAELQKALKDQFTKTSINLKSHEARYKDFSYQTGLKTQNERNQVYSFGRSEAQKAVWANKKV